MRLGRRSDLELPQIDDQLQAARSEIVRAKRCMGDIVVLETLQQFRLNESWKAVAPLHIGKIPFTLRSFGEQEALGLQPRGGSGFCDRQVRRQRTAGRVEGVGALQFIDHLAWWRSGARHALDACNDAVETG